MTMYQYKCPGCHAAIAAPIRANNFEGVCGSCGYEVEFKRVWSVNVKPMMHEHFNQSTGTVVSDMKQFEAELRMKSDKASEQTGIEHRYKPLEYGDHAAFGATSEGIHESNVERSRRGEALLPMID